MAEETGRILLLVIAHPPQHHSTSNEVIPNCIISWNSYSSDRSDDVVSCLAELNVIYLHLIFPKAIDRKIDRKTFYSLCGLYHFHVMSSDPLAVYHISMRFMWGAERVE